MMRSFLAACALGVIGAATLPAPSAHAWWDGYGRWHPDYPRPYYAPPVVVAPPPPVAYYPRPYGRWVPAHYNRWGQFVPGHWI